MTDVKTRRFAINPDPLKVVEIERTPWNPRGKRMAVDRIVWCQRIVEPPDGRCSRHAVRMVNGEALCTQHAKIAERKS
jgi:hypothetical protein